MASKITRQATNGIEKQFLDRFNSLCQTRSSWQVWSDFITVAAIALANSVDMVEKYGYTDQAHLLHDFKKRHLMTPLEAMKLAREKR